MGAGPQRAALSELTLAVVGERRHDLRRHRYPAPTASRLERYELQHAVHTLELVPDVQNAALDHPIWQVHRWLHSLLSTHRGEDRCLIDKK